MKKVLVPASVVKMVAKQEDKLVLNKSTKIKDWYHNNWPKDTMYKDLLPSVKFSDVYRKMFLNKKPTDFYTIVFKGNSGDSIIRERIFTGLAAVYPKLTYDIIYDKWLDNAEKLNPELANIKIEVKSNLDYTKELDKDYICENAKNKLSNCLSDISKKYQIRELQVHKYGNNKLEVKVDLPIHYSNKQEITKVKQIVEKYGFEFYGFFGTFHISFYIPNNK